MKVLFLGLAALAALTGPAAAADEAALERAFETALAAVPDPATLTDDQANWRDIRELDCANDENGDIATPEATAACVAGENDARIRYLLGRPLAGPGAPEPMIPLVQAGGDGIFNHALRFADPQGAGAKAFNAALDSYLADIHLGQSEDDYSDQLEMSLAYASPHLLSANIDLVYLSAQYAHAMPYNFSINIDLDSGRRLVLGDVVAPGAIAGIEAECESQMTDFIAAGELGDDIRRGKIATIVGDLDFWTFGDAAATLRYVDFDLETPAECVLGYDLLRPLVRPGFLLPR